MPNWGVKLIIRPHQSLFFAVNTIHISNASLSDLNPGVNISTPIQSRIFLVEIDFPENPGGLNRSMQHLC